MSSCNPIVWAGHDNPRDWSVTWKDPAEPFDLDANGITKVAVVVGTQTFDSDAHPSAIAWVGDVLTTNIDLLVTQDPGVVDGRFVFYGAGHPNGKVWDSCRFDIR